jgi:UDP-N-acetylglucosamine transferase subunit ALG13
LPGSELVAQHGPARAPANAARSSPFLSFAEVLEEIDRSRVVVSHAGVGSVICAIRAGHVPLVVPRLRRYRETTDDHQVEFARALAERGKVIVVWDVDRLEDHLAQTPVRRPREQVRELPIHAAVRTAILAS